MAEHRLPYYSDTVTVLEYLVIERVELADDHLVHDVDELSAALRSYFGDEHQLA